MRASQFQLHLVTEPRRDFAELLAAVEAALAGGVDWVQLRNKSASAATTFSEARRLLELTRPNGMVLVSYAPVVKGKVTEDATIRRIAERHGATPGQVALAWLLAIPGVALAIPPVVLAMSGVAFAFPTRPAEFRSLLARALMLPLPWPFRALSAFSVLMILSATISTEVLPLLATATERLFLLPVTKLTLAAFVTGFVPAAKAALLQALLVLMHPIAPAAPMGVVFIVMARHEGLVRKYGVRRALAELCRQYEI